MRLKQIKLYFCDRAVIVAARYLVERIFFVCIGVFKNSDM